jgi:hypothetical protein
MFFAIYEPSQLTSLSSRKSWGIFAFSIEKIEFYLYMYHSQTLSVPWIYVRSHSIFLA